MQEFTPAEITRYYNAAMDSVYLINKLKTLPTPLSTKDADTMERNVAHLRIVLAKDFWTTQDLTPFQNAII